MDYPDRGLYCPAREAHPERRNRILAAISDEAIFVHCREHDWLRVELFRLGDKITFKNASAIASQVKPNKGHRVIFEDLKKVPIHAKGDFKVRSRAFREQTVEEKIKHLKEQLQFFENMRRSR